MSEPATPNPDLARGPSQTGFLRARLNGMGMHDLQELAAYLIGLRKAVATDPDHSPAVDRLLNEVHLAVDQKIGALLSLARKANEEGAFDGT